MRITFRIARIFCRMQGESKWNFHLDSPCILKEILAILKVIRMQGEHISLISFRIRITGLGFTDLGSFLRIARISSRMQGESKSCDPKSDSCGSPRDSYDSPRDSSESPVRCKVIPSPATWLLRTCDVTPTKKHIFWQTTQKQRKIVMFTGCGSKSCDPKEDSFESPLECKVNQSPATWLLHTRNVTSPKKLFFGKHAPQFLCCSTCGYRAHL